MAKTLRTLRNLSIALAAIGLIDSLYLMIIKLTNNKGLCLQGIGDCWTVNTSRYSEISGIPISILGALAYLAILVLLYLETREGFWNEYSSIFVFGIALTGTLYSAYLTYLEIAVIKAICPFCVISAVVITALLVISIIRMIRSDHTELNS